jgi:hypothetical protein
MKRLSLFLVFLCASLRVSAEANALKLDVYSVVMSASEFGQEKKYVLEVRSFVTNTGELAVTIPTSTPSGSWSGLAQQGDSRTVIYSIGFGELGTKKTKIVISPFRHFPVELQPGEATELPMQEFHMPAADTLKKIKIVFIVDADFAKRFGWWSGTLRIEHVVGEGENPFIVPVGPPFLAEPNQHLRATEQGKSEVSGGGL